MSICIYFNLFYSLFGCTYMGLYYFWYYKLELVILLSSTYTITCVFYFYLFSLHTSRPVSLVQTSLCRSLMANSIWGHGKAFGCVSIATVLGPEKSLSLSTVPSGTQIGLLYRLTRPQPRLVANKQPKVTVFQEILQCEKKNDEKADSFID